MSEDKIFETLPYLGLDIEDRQGDVVSVEYSPNRPDFSSEVGIARSLVGILGLESGAPKYLFMPSKYKVTVAEDEVIHVRPSIAAFYAEITVTDELIKQIISMQEDLHNGIGRRRTKVAIGFHNAEAISNHIKYRATKDRNFSFAPLGSETIETIGGILERTEQGVAYGKLLTDTFPILEDSTGNVLSMPPIINGNVTRIAAGQSKLFVDVTGTDVRIVDISTAIIAAMLADSGGRVYSAEIVSSQGSVSTPDMTPKSMRFDLNQARELMGYDFTAKEVEGYLAKCRIGMYSNGNAIVPRYRFDIMHSIDLIEEVALGFGIQHIRAQDLKTSLVGSFSNRQEHLESVIEALVGLGLTEVWNLSLTGGNESNERLLKLQDSKTQNLEFLRSSLVLSLLSVLRGSTHQEYPQRIFEQATVFKPSTQTMTGVSEEEHAALMIADSSARYSLIHSITDCFLQQILERNTSISYRSDKERSYPFAAGRSAVVSISNERVKNLDLGVLGEIDPFALEKYGLKVPVVGFEVNLDPLIKE